MPQLAYALSFWIALFCVGALVIYKTIRSFSALKIFFTKSNVSNGENIEDLPLIKYNNINHDTKFFRFQVQYLIVYIFMVAGDWLQGPYIYALYEAYGYKQHEIAFIFTIGFASSMLAGTFVGSLADRFGRRNAAALYGTLYIISCLTKHSSQLSWLLLGRVLGGISTSLLFTVFESWYVCEHNQKQFCETRISETLSTAAFFNSIVAIFSGAAAQAVSSIRPLQLISGTDTWYWGGYIMPFDLAIPILTVGTCLVFFMWKENYGDRTNFASPVSQFSAAVEAVRSNNIIIAVGLSQSLFEGAMYIFVFMWTPALSEHSPLPYGTVFATFMMCSMLGSQLFIFIITKYDIIPEQLLTVVFTIAALSLFIGPIGVQFDVKYTTAIYTGFLIFEVCCGVYFPAMGTMKSNTVPEAHRSAVYNMFRVPLNIVVLVVLQTSLSENNTFLLCGLLLCCAAVVQQNISSKLKSTRKNFITLSND